MSLSLFNRNQVPHDPSAVPRRRFTPAYAALTLKVTLSKEALEDVYERIIIGIIIKHDEINEGIAHMSFSREGRAAFDEASKWGDSVPPPTVANFHHCYDLLYDLTHAHQFDQHKINSRVFTAQVNSTIDMVRSLYGLPPGTPIVARGFQHMETQLALCVLHGRILEDFAQSDGLSVRLKTHYAVDDTIVLIHGLIDAVSEMQAAGSIVLPMPPNTTFKSHAQLKADVSQYLGTKITVYLQARAALPPHIRERGIRSLTKAKVVEWVKIGFPQWSNARAAIHADKKVKGRLWSTNAVGTVVHRTERRRYSSAQYFPTFPLVVASTTDDFSVVKPTAPATTPAPRVPAERRLTPAPTSPGVAGVLLTFPSTPPTNIRPVSPATMSSVGEPLPRVNRHHTPEPLVSGDVSISVTQVVHGHMGQAGHFTEYSYHGEHGEALGGAFDRPEEESSDVHGSTASEEIQDVPGAVSYRRHDGSLGLFQFAPVTGHDAAVEAMRTGVGIYDSIGAPEGSSSSAGGQGTPDARSPPPPVRRRGFNEYAT
ncbi:uncharacterized protein LOC62_04G006534 [Vanrija pseudolonga]|uniref:Uncharacterized protein n=1 Tax=Vanrija pseudolonga TaxID=143232 RepID=A0AAF1BNE3_9TREE|nr:hypothetical protein LOC62_04G006534 [Vanrija pseudolonga]